MNPTWPRRRFVRLMLGALGGSAVAVRPGALGAASATPSGTVHPDPRPGVDASRVLTADQLRDTPELIPLYDGVREIPHVVDGIRCYCGCAGLDGYRSLLTCYEQSGMPKHCHICRGQGRLAHDRWKEGQTLDQIRRATDARFGPGSPAGRSASPPRHASRHPPPAH